MDSEISTNVTAAKQSRLGGLAEAVLFMLFFMLSLGISVGGAGENHLSFKITAIGTIIRDAIFVLLAFWLIRRSGDPPQSIGWCARPIWKEIWVGVLLFIPFFIGSSLITVAFKDLGLKSPMKSLPSYLTPVGTWQYLLALLLVIAAAISEETIFRGYLMLRLSRAFRSAGLAVIVSSAIFAVGHKYEGTAGMATVGVMGVAFGLIYLWRKSLVAPMTIHFLQDFLGVILLPLLTRK